MSGTVWCTTCKRNVVPEKKFNILVFALIGGMLYLPYYHLLKRKRCPICGGHDFGPQRPGQVGPPPYSLTSHRHE